MTRSTSRATRAVHLLGTLAACACLIGGIAFELLGRPLDPLAVSTAGIVVLLITPALGLAVSALEVRSSDRRAAVTALAVLAILAVSAALATQVLG